MACNRMLYIPLSISYHSKMCNWLIIISLKHNKIEGTQAKTIDCHILVDKTSM